MKTLPFYSALSTSIVTAVTFFIAVLTPPLAGPWCKSGCFEYPYLNIASRFPRDYYWMYPAMLLSIVFIVLMASIHQYAGESKKLYSLSALIFAGISSATLFIDYFIQVTVMQPSLLKGEADGISLLSQYNPHGVFIALEEVGYFLMSLALFCTVPVFSKGNKLERTIRVIHFTSFSLSAMALSLISGVSGINREYRFEVAVITIDWITLIVSGILLSRLFNKNKVVQ
jgi:hypothetical protein